MISLWSRSLCFYYTHKIRVSPHFRNGFSEPPPPSEGTLSGCVPGPISGLQSWKPEPGPEFSMCGWLGTEGREGCRPEQRSRLLTCGLFRKNVSGFH